MASRKESMTSYKIIFQHKLLILFILQKDIFPKKDKQFRYIDIVYKVISRKTELSHDVRIRTQNVRIRTLYK